MGRAPIPENISGRKLTRVLNSAGSVLVHLRYVTKRPRTGEGCDPGNSGFWERDYGWGVRVHRPFGARGMSSVRYGTWLGDLKNKQSTESLMSAGIGCISQCVECLIGKQKKPILFKVTEPSSIPYRTHSACAKRAAYPDPPPVIPLPESIAAQAVYQLRYKSTEYCSWVSSGPKCFQVLGLSPSLLPNPML